MTPTEKWEAAVARYEAAVQVHGASCDAVAVAETGLFAKSRSDPKADRQGLELIYGVEAARRVQDAACQADEKAYRALMATPAPTVEAALKKLEIFRREAPEIEAVEDVIEDLKRLTGGAA